MNEKKNLQVAIDHSNHGFFSDGMSIFSRIDKFFIDFRQNTPRIDVLGDKQQQINALKHNTVILDPLMAKALLNLLQESLNQYEKQFGKIKVPKRTKSKTQKLGITDQNYIG